MSLTTFEARGSRWIKRNYSQLIKGLSFRISSTYLEIHAGVGVGVHSGPTLRQELWVY